jgi:hypothetical protein
MGKVLIEGKEVALDDSIINAGITAVKAALSVDFPDVENADVQIVTPARVGAPRTATVVKRGTGKGGFSLVAGRSTQSAGKSTKEHVEHNAVRVAQELFRHVEASNRPGVMVELANTSCTCGSKEAHPDLHFLVVVGGPFDSPEHAMDALAEVAAQRADLLRSNQSLQRKPLTSSDITGGQ